MGEFQPGCCLSNYPEKIILLSIILLK